MANKEETFLLVSLEEDKAKKLAQVISNDTCRKILDYLSAKKATETELSQQLNIPISTVHYNLKHLVDNKLVEAEEFHYSEKGKEVLHYSLSNKYVIIAPKGVSEKFRDKLKSIIGAVLSVGAIAFAIQFLPALFAKTGTARIMSYQAVDKVSGALSVPEAVTQEAAPLMTQNTAGNVSVSGAAQVMASSAGSSPPAVQAAIAPMPVLLPEPFYQQTWFLIMAGALLCVLLYLLFEYLRKRGKR